MNDEYRKRLPKFEAFDRIELQVVPRYKTSGLSGDVWRTSVAVTFLFKGVVVGETSFRDMKAALLMLGHVWVTNQEPIPQAVIDLERDRCEQPGCKALHNGKRRYLKRQTAADGHYLAESETPFADYRLFCDQHSTRGDCSREDSDDNYTDEKPEKKREPLVDRPSPEKEGR